MGETIDGAQDLPKQESAIQFKEAKGYEMLEFKADTKAPPANLAEFKRLPKGRPLRIHLVKKIPEGKTAVWTGTIHVLGKSTKAFAYRE